LSASRPPPRHCERKRRPAIARGASDGGSSLTLLAMTSRCEFAISPRVSREFCRKRLALFKQRAQGRPGARCTRGLACKLATKKTHTSIQVQRKHSGLPCAVVLRLTSRSPRRPGFLATVISGSLPANLTPASGCQGHTTSPSAVSAVRLASPPRPPHPAPRS
jgi:hypothetical protein